MEAEKLAIVEGGILGIDDALFWTVAGSYVIGRTIDAGIEDLTNQCRRNPNQWFCIHV
ncbi:bacteriocin [Streptococcus himalayensis]|uniref:Uncharacterized protein n=1 Tax=Streptococcus himalayensis TaxID=1888195 RepID=A0A917A6L9_9STRE|nr:bacteriocin [Streptococcus himalayensis]GGE29017.1 hypothetical protein GCM10011510_07880 [Streptococcus himalayensis]